MQQLTGVAMACNFSRGRLLENCDFQFSDFEVTHPSGASVRLDGEGHQEQLRKALRCLCETWRQRWFQDFLRNPRREAGVQWTSKGWLLATHLEATYSRLLCFRWAQCFTHLVRDTMENAAVCMRSIYNGNYEKIQHLCGNFAIIKSLEKLFVTLPRG